MRKFMRTSCMRGHEYTEQNTYIEKRVNGEKRRCRICNAERARNIRKGIAGLPMLPEISIKEYFVQRINKTECCWLWSGSLTDGGYGKIGHSKYRDALAHRIAYELFKGPIPKGKQLDHLCRIRACVNPLHLEPVTLKQNVFRGVGITAKNRLKTSCCRGHDFTKENTSFTEEGHRVCKMCANIRSKKFYHLKSPTPRK